MTTATKRPTAARKVTTKTEAKRESELDQGVRFTLDGGETWLTLRIGDVTPSLARELRRETGRGFMALVTLVGEDPDLDVIAEAVWFAKRIQGEQIALDDVELDYGVLLSDDFDADTTATAEEPDSPEA